MSNSKHVRAVHAVVVMCVVEARHRTRQVEMGSKLGVFVKCLFAGMQLYGACC